MSTVEKAAVGIVKSSDCIDWIVSTSACDISWNEDDLLRDSEKVLCDVNETVARLIPGEQLGNSHLVLRPGLVGMWLPKWLARNLHVNNLAVVRQRVSLRHHEDPAFALGELWVRSGQPEGFDHRISSKVRAWSKDSVVDMRGYYNNTVIGGSSARGHGMMVHKDDHSCFGQSSFDETVIFERHDAPQQRYGLTLAEFTSFFVSSATSGVVAGEEHIRRGFNHDVLDIIHDEDTPKCFRDMHTLTPSGAVEGVAGGTAVLSFERYHKGVSLESMGDITFDSTQFICSLVIPCYFSQMHRSFEPTLWRKAFGVHDSDGRVLCVSEECGIAVHDDVIGYKAQDLGPLKFPIFESRPELFIEKLNGVVCTIRQASGALCCITAPWFVSFNITAPVAAIARWRARASSCHSSTGCPATADTLPYHYVLALRCICSWIRTKFLEARLQVGVWLLEVGMGVEFVGRVVQMLVFQMM